MMRVWAAAVVLWMMPAVAFGQDPATDAALEADAVNQEECANLYSATVGTAASSTVRVAEVWQKVSEVYEQTQAPYLLFWRGALAQCLGREDAAIADLEQFAETQKGSTMFSNLVDNAQRRLRRLGGRSGVGQGLAAAWLRQGAALEVVARWGIAPGLTLLSCADDGTRDTGAPINSACMGGVNPQTAARPMVSWSTLDLGVDGFFGRSFGVGVRGIVDLTQSAAGPGPSTELSSKPLLPVAEIQVGPQLRILNNVASGARAGWLRGTLRFAAAFGRLSPWAGQASELESLGAFHDAGTYALAHVGPALTVAGGFEAGKAGVFEIEGRFSWYVPLPGDQIPKARSGQAVTVASGDGNETRDELIPEALQPALVRGGRLHAGFRLGAWRPLPGGMLALGPFFDFSLQQTFLRFPDAEEDVWCALGEAGDGSSLCSGTGDLRKVYSTQRDDLRLTIGIQARFGVIGQGG